MEPTEQNQVPQSETDGSSRRCDPKKKYTYSAEQRREYEMTYRAKHPGGRKRITAKYTKANPAVYAASAKRYQQKLKGYRDELLDLKAKLVAANIVL